MQYIRTKQSSIMRKIRRSCAIKKKINIRRNNLKKSKQPKYHKHKQSYLPNPYEKYEISLSGDFRLLDNTDYVIRSINEITDFSQRYGKYRISLDMSEIRYLDVGAIGLLLSAINTLSKSNCLVYGNVPNKDECKQLFYDSGFLDHVSIIQGKNPKRDTRNLMIEKGFDKTSNLRIGKEVRNAVNHLTGLEESYRPVYGIIQEMCANSIEHANQKRRHKNWLMSTYYSEDKVIFAMTDIGSGILGTLKKKFLQIPRDIFADSIQVLEGVFDKKYQSSTFDKNRNKGLPKIKETNTKKYIENLKVITNNVFLNFDEPSLSKVLATKLRGTFYYWELTNKAILQWKQRMN